MTGHPLADALRDRLVIQLVADGHLVSRPWVDAFHTVPRHLLLPRVFRPTVGGWLAVHPDDSDWIPTVYADTALVTQLDGDDDLWIQALDGAVSGTPTAVARRPSQVARSLEAAELEPRDRVLQIGAGSGYTTALLAHRLGSTHVTTVDPDPANCDQIEKTVHRCGYTPRLIHSDSAGLPEAPFDVVLVTEPTATIRPAWITQVATPGLVIASLHRPLGDLLVQISVTADPDRQARGWFLPDPHPHLPERLLQSGAPMYEEVYRKLGNVLQEPGYGLMAALTIPSLPSDPQEAVEQLLSAREVWERAGRPARDRFGLTVTTTGEHRVWLHTPANILLVTSP